MTNHTPTADQHELELTLLSLAEQYDGLVLDEFIHENLFYLAWTPFQIRRAADELVRKGRMTRSLDEGRVVLQLRQDELSVTA